MTDKQPMLNAAEIKAELLAMLVEFDEFCAHEDLRYSLAGGTLLGAVRHRGFIPWDDDIDLSMPRVDFEKFLTSAKAGHTPDGLSVVPYSGNWEHPVFVKVVSDTIAVDTRYEDGAGRLWLDILPIDGLPDDMGELEGVYSQADRYRAMVAFCMAHPHEGKTGMKRLLKPILVPFARLVGLLPWASKRLESLAIQREYGSTPWVGAVTWGLYGPGERYPKTGWDEMTELEFEGKEFPAIGCWDEYLHGIYGDYMQLPPVEKRATHEMKAWRIG